jgi:hypothetical protein
MTDEKDNTNSDQAGDNLKKMSNAKVAVFVTMIPVMLFIASFFIQRG